jgi:hypothetical protein
VPNYSAFKSEIIRSKNAERLPRPFYPPTQTTNQWKKMSAKSKAAKTKKSPPNLKDMKPKKDVKGGGDITITHTTDSSSGTIQK